MNPADMLSLLWQRTPYLFGGFLMNLLITVVAMFTGTALGIAMGLARQSGRRLWQWPARLITSLFRNVPSFVLMFYIAFVMPAEFHWGATIVQTPLWLKATIALIMPVVGFASDQTLAFVHQSRRGEDDAATTFLVAWVQYCLIVLMASAFASTIGVDEVVGRANRIITADNDPIFLLITYSYVCLWFLLAGLAVSCLARLVQRNKHTS